MDEINTILKYVVMGIDIVALLVLLIYLLKGFVIGWRKMLINLISFLIPFILLLIILTPLAKIISEISFGSIGTVTDMVVDGIDVEMELSPETIELCSSIAVSAIKIAVYIVGLIACVILSIINKVILKIILKGFIKGDRIDPDDKKSKIKKSARFIGMLVGVFSFLVFCLICYSPILGVMNIADITLDEIDKLEITIENANTGMTDVSSSDDIDFQLIRSTINKSIIYNVSKIGANRETGITLTSRYLGEIISVNTDKIKTNIVDEFSLIKPLIPIINKMVSNIENNNSIDLSNFSSTDIEKINNFLSKSKIIYQLSPVIKDGLIHTIKQSEIENKNEVVKIIKDLNMIDELKIIVSSLQVALNECPDLLIDFDNPIQVLRNDKLPNCVNGIINQLLESKIIEHIVIPTVVKEIDKNLIEELEVLKPLFTTESIKEFLSKDVKQLFIIYQDLVKNTNLEEFLRGNEQLKFVDNDSIEAFSQAIAKLLDISLIKGNEQILVEFAFNKLKNEDLDYESLFQDVNPNWEDEKRHIVNVLDEMLKLLNNQLHWNFQSLDQLLVKNENNEYIFMPLLNEIASSQMFTKVVTNYLSLNFSKLIDDNIPEKIKNIFDFMLLKNMSTEEFKEEITRFLNIFDTLVEMNIIYSNDENLNITKENIARLVNEVFNSVFVKNKEKDIIAYILDEININEALNEYNITLNFDNVNWDAEPQKLINVFNAILDYGDISSVDFGKLLDDRTKENETRLINLFVALGESEVFNSALYPIIEQGVETIGYKIVITEEDKIKISANGWTKEVTVIFEIIDDCQEFLNDSVDFQSIAGDKVAEIMLNASQSVIASKIIGTVLEDMLGPNNLNIMPKNSDGTNKYDLSDPVVLAECARDIGTIIDLRQNINNFDINDLTNGDEIINNIVNNLETIQQSELVKDVMAEYLDISDTDTIDLKKDATIIQDVYDEYVSNPDDFNINEYDKLKEEVENSDAAKAILELLGIL